MTDQSTEAPPQPPRQRSPEVRPRRRRRRLPVRALLVLLALFALVGAALLLVQLLTTGTVSIGERRCQPLEQIDPAGEGQRLILLADFAGAGGREAAAVLRRDIAGRPGPIAIHACETASDAEAARALGKQVNASLVIWGTTGGGPTAHLEVLRQPASFRSEADYRVPPRLPDAYTFALAANPARDAPFVGGVAAGYAAALTFDMSLVQAELEGALESQPGGGSGDEQARLDGNAAQAHFALGTLRMVLTADAPGAFASLDWATRLNPDDPDAQYNRAAALYRQSGQEALPEFSRLIDREPSYAPAYNGRGASYALLGDVPAARADFNQALALDAALAPAYYNRGLLSAEEGDLEGALADFTQAIQSDSTFAPAYKERGTANLRQGDPQAALSDYQLAVAYNPNYEQAYVSRGLAYFELEDYNAAVADFNRALQAQPDDLDTIRHRGIAAFLTGDYLLAISDLTIVLEAQPEDAEALVYRGNAFFGRRNYAAAEADFNAALTLEPDNPELYFTRAQARRALKDFTAALLDYDRAIEGGYDEADIFLSRGNMVYFDLADPESALPDFQAAIQRDPQSEDARHGIALALYELGLYPESEEAWRDLLDVDAFEGEHHAGLALVLDAQEKREEAVSAYLQGILLDERLLSTSVLRDEYHWNDEARLSAADLLNEVVARLRARVVAESAAEVEAEAGAAETESGP